MVLLDIKKDTNIYHVRYIDISLTYKREIEEANIRIDETLTEQEDFMNLVLSTMGQNVTVWDMETARLLKEISNANTYPIAIYNTYLLNDALTKLSNIKEYVNKEDRDSIEYLFNEINNCPDNLSKMIRLYDDLWDIQHIYRDLKTRVYLEEVPKLEKGSLFKFLFKSKAISSKIDEISKSELFKSVKLNFSQI